MCTVSIGKTRYYASDLYIRLYCPLTYTVIRGLTLLSKIPTPFVTFNFLIH